MKLSQILLLALLALTMVVAIARADDTDFDDVAGEDNENIEMGSDDSDYNPDEETKDPNAISGVFARATFNKDLVPSAMPAGEKVTSFVGFKNAEENPAYNVMFVMAHLTHAVDRNYYYMNFTGTRPERNVAPGETASFRYQFTPDEGLEPNDYGLVVKLYFMNDNNQTYVTVAYNDTVTVSEPLGADPKTFMTFGVVGSIIAAVGYFGFGIGAAKKASKGSKKSGAVEMGTGEAYDPEYVSQDHIAFAERKVKSASPNKRK